MGLKTINFDLSCILLHVIALLSNGIINIMAKIILLNKPYGVLPQFTDQAGRPTLKELVPFPGVYAVGRLDLDSEGLLLLTDDGELNHALSSPKNKQPKTYWAQVEGLPDDKALEKLRKGIVIEGKKTLPAEAKKIAEPTNLWPRSKPVRFRKNIPTSWLELTLHEGRNRQVRKMTAAIGHPCLRLIRTGLGPYKLGKLLPGEFCLSTGRPGRFSDNY